MEVRLKHPKYYDEFAQLIQTNDSIVACFYMTGDFDFILKLSQIHLRGSMRFTGL